jgi:uncharacterized membrane protein YeaQ/YmgE (transglycosylase-associated protein family)
MATFADIVLEPGGIIAWLVVGLIAGWLAGLVMKGGGFGLVGDMIIGLIGAVIGGLLFGQFVSGTPQLLGSILVAFIGACLLIAVVRLITRGQTSL